MNQRKIRVSDEEIKEAFDSLKTLHEAAASFNMTTVTLWRRAKQIGIQWKEKKIRKGGRDKIDLNEILSGMHPYYQTFKLKNRLIKEGIKEDRCEECKIDSWNGKKLAIQLDHIDGNPHNHLLENLKMLCPNCHSQTETFCGKKK